MRRSSLNNKQNSQRKSLGKRLRQELNKVANNSKNIHPIYSIIKSPNTLF
jgi:hypothetical protein